MRMSKNLSQALVLLLMLDAAWVACGLYHGRIMWPWIVAYCAVLTIKNLVDYIGGRKR